MTIEARATEVPASELARLDGELAALAAERPGAPDEELAGDAVPTHTQPLKFAAYAGGAEVLTGETETLAALTLSWGDRPVVAHDWKSIASGEEPCDAPPLEHDTMVAAYLLDPAGRAYPLLEISEREGLGAQIEGGSENGGPPLGA